MQKAVYQSDTMPTALETNFDEAVKQIKIYSECGAYIGLTCKNGTCKVWPRVKHREVFYKCVVEKGGKINKEWLEPSVEGGEDGSK